MAAPFDASNASIYGDYLQLSGSGTAAPTGSSRGLSFLFASSSTGQLGDTRLYLINGSGSASQIATEADSFNFTVAGDSGANQSMTDGNTLTLAGGDGIRSVGSATDTITFHMDINALTALTAVADADTLAIDDNNSDDIKRITRAHLLGSALAAFDNGLTTTTLSATGDVDLGDATSDTITVTGRFDSDLVPSSNNARDLGSSILQYANVHAYKLNSYGSDNGGSAWISGSLVVANNFVLSGTLNANGDINLGNATSDTITCTGQFDSDLVPSTDSARDLGTSAKQWAELHVDTGYIDALGANVNAGGNNITNVKHFEADGTISVTGSVQASQNISASVGLQAGTLNLVSFASNWTNAGRTVADAGILTTVDINGGTADNVVIGGATAAAGTFTTLVAGGNVDLGDATSDTITATGRFDSDLTPSTDNARDLGAAALRYAQAHVVEAHIDQLGQALSGNSQNITQVASLQASQISGTVSVEGGSAYFTALSSSQLQDTSLTAARVVFAGSNGVLSDDGDMTFATDTLTVTKLGAFEAAGAINFASQAMTNVDINSGAIDGTIIGAASAAAGTFAAVVASSLNVSDGDITNVGDIALDSISADGTDMDITLTDNQSAALEIKEGSNVYLAFSTANGQEAIAASKSFIPGSDNAISFGAASMRWSQGHIVALHADQLGQALDGNSQNATGFGNLYGSALSGSVSVGGGAGTLVTLAVAGGTVSGDVALALPSSKDIKARAFVTYSERSLKTNIQPMNNALDTVKKMQGVTYDLRNGGKNEVGFIADEMAQVVPEVCQFKDDGTAAGLDYGRLTSVLVEAIKSQQAQIEELTSKLDK